MNGERGFTVLELLLAMVMTAMIATAAFAALNVFVEADARAIQRAGIAVDVSRALALLQRDARYATAVDVQSNQMTLTQANGTSVVYAMPAGGTELHRWVTVDVLNILTTVQTVVLSAAPPPEYSTRGHLKDSSYDATAVIQGAVAMRAAVVRSVRSGRAIGLSLAVDHVSAGVVERSQCVALSLPLAERYAKP